MTVEQVLQMSSGVRWNETYRDPKSDRRQMFDAQLAERPGGILRLLASLPRQYPAGTHFTAPESRTCRASCCTRRPAFR